MVVVVEPAIVAPPPPKGVIGAAGNRLATPRRSLRPSESLEMGALCNSESVSPSPATQAVRKIYPAHFHEAAAVCWGRSDRSERGPGFG